MNKSGQIVFSSLKQGEIGDPLIGELFEIEQDMWARKEGLGEYFFCESCNSTFSKQDIFGHIDETIYNNTVTQIEKILGFSGLCHVCQEKMQHCYNKEEYIPQMRERYSQKANLIIMSSQNGIIGFMDGYIGDFSKIYELEFKSHYSEVGENNMKHHIEEKLEYKLPTDLFSCSSMGTLEEFMSFRYAYLLLQSFFLNLSQEYSSVTAITELNMGGSLDKLYSSLGAKRMYFPENLSTQSHIPKANSYVSDIYIQEDLGSIYRQAFGTDLRTFLKRYQAVIKK